VRRVIVIGAGMGGLAAAADLARAGCSVTLLERAAVPGGKCRQVSVRGAGIDAGPTVFTMQWVFDALFRDAGARLEDHVTLVPGDVLARHAWRAGGRLDLHADVDRSAAAIGEFAGAADARGYREFVARSGAVHDALRDTFMAAERPSPAALVARLGASGLGAMWRTAPWSSLWSALGSHFRDPRLRQLFARYATYVGSSPLAAPATLMLIAHVEQQGVWLVEGGMAGIARALESLGRGLGVQYRYGAHVQKIVARDRRVRGVELDSGEFLEADAIVFNGDAAALAAGALGAATRSAAPPVTRAARGLSAITWCLNAPSQGFGLSHHNVFFAEDYPQEFRAIFAGRRVTATPTVYLCAQDRGPGHAAPDGGPERMLLLVNAPADGDQGGVGAADLARIEAAAFGLLRDCGLEFTRTDGDCVVTRPQDFEQLFPASGGSLYGRANHGALGSFRRPGSRSRLGGLYLAGGSAHPGPGIPMATLSGRLAAARLLADLG
jgi:1-hydroxycarotenoid 3,4-desaturase